LYFFSETTFPNATLSLSLSLKPLAFLPALLVAWTANEENLTPGKVSLYETKYITFPLRKKINPKTINKE